MTFSKLPPVLRWWDFLTFGMNGVYTFGFLIYGLVHGVQGTSSAVAQWPYLMTATGLAFFFIYWRVILIRKKEIAGFVLIGAPKYGFAINFGMFPSQGLDQLIPSIVTRLEGKWADVPESPFSLSTVDAALTSDLIWVWFKPGDVDLPHTASKVAGYTVYRQMVVGYKEGATLEQTAFEHELGHVIQGSVTNVWDQSIHHARSKKYGLP